MSEDITEYEAEGREFIAKGKFLPRYEYWAAMAYWELDEAVALTIDLEPSALDRTDFPIRVKQYIRLKMQAVANPIKREWEGASIKPFYFVRWAKLHYIDFPQTLAQLIQPLDPDRKYSNAQQTSEAVKSTEKTLGTRERDTLLKLVIGMAVAGYKYNPKASKNAAVSDIASDLERLGIAVSDDTVRKWLSEAAEFLPQEPQKT